jgi:hypothetical protein
MNRRDFVQATTAFAAIAATGVRAATTRRRPNLLYVFSDQHRAAARRAFQLGLRPEPRRLPVRKLFDGSVRLQLSAMHAVSRHPDEWALAVSDGSDSQQRRAAVERNLTRPRVPRCRLPHRLCRQVASAGSRECVHTRWSRSPRVRRLACLGARSPARRGP